MFATLYDHLGFLKSTPARGFFALAYTLLVTVLLVQSSSQPLVGPPAPPGPPNLVREIELTLGHVVAFSGLVVLWWWALVALLPTPRALFVAAAFALIFGLLTEVAQSLVADRQASLFDLAVNWTVTVFVSAYILEKWRGGRPNVYRTSEPSSKMPVG
jgi:VanZ family protein